MNNNELIRIGVEQKSMPRHLYKYRGDNEFTQKIITENELWFSNPLIFNDPFDCNIPIDTNNSIDEIKDWLKNIGVYDENIEMLSNQLKNNPNVLLESSRSVISNTGVCCFSSMYDNILQWSHYSDYHKGICLEFDITKSPDTFVTPIIVSYRKIMPHYNHLIHAPKIIEYLIQPKYFEWSYESEVRIVKMNSQIENNSGNRSFKFNDDSLTQIIFGTNCSDETIEKYMNLCENHNKHHVKFSRMKLGNGTNYELVKVDI